MPHLRKDSPRNVLLKLPPEQMELLCGWLVSPNSYGQVQKKLADEFGVQISLQGISQFYRKFVAQEIGHRDELIRSLVRKKVEERVSTSATPAMGVRNPNHAA